jgi:predicted Zn-dependent peptidase
MKEINLKGLNEVVYYDECSNGLKVYLWVNKKVNSFYATLSVRYGSIYKDFKVGNKTYSTPYGIAHFLEHIKFNESDNYSAQDYFKESGCDTNAFTTFDYTNYQVFGNMDCAKNVCHLLDFVENGYFTKKIVKDEKGIIVEEANSTIDNPYAMLYFNMIHNLFNHSDYSKIITGEEKDIKSITYDDIKLVFNTFYHPKNMFLIVTGNFNPYEIMGCIKENESKKEVRKFTKPTRIVVKENKKVREKYEEVCKNVSTKKIQIGIKIPTNNLKKYDDIYIRLLLNILMDASFGSTSDFREELLSKELINNMGYSFDLIDNYYIITIIIESNYKEEIIKLINDKLDNICINESEFNRKKKCNIATLILDYESVETVNDLLQFEILKYGKVIDDYKEKYENIEYKDILDFIDLINLKERSILIYNPKE